VNHIWDIGDLDRLPPSWGCDSSKDGGGYDTYARLPWCTWWSPSALPGREHLAYPDSVMTSGFRTHDRPNHTGADYLANGPLVAPFDGRVVAVGSNDVSGNYIILEDASRTVRVQYVHMGYPDFGRKKTKVQRRVRVTEGGLWVAFTDLDVDYDLSSSAAAVGQGHSVLYREAERLESTGPHMPSVAVESYAEWIVDFIWDQGVAHAPSRMEDSFAGFTFVKYLRRNDPIKTGDLVGWVGNTGRVRSRHGPPSPSNSRAGQHLHLIVERRLVPSYSYERVDPTLVNWSLT
jgi:hypothetical protein